MASRNRGRTRKTIRDLSREWPSFEEKRAVTQALLQAGASPIVVAILGAAMLEHELEQSLRPRFRHKDDETWTKITDLDGPLGTFHAKIVAGYAFGIFDGTIREAFHTVRRIRNAFVHSKKLIAFDNELIAAELTSVDLPEKKKGKLYRDLNLVRKVAQSEPQVAFYLLCLAVENHLMRKRIKVTRAKTRYWRRAAEKLYRANPFLRAFAEMTGALPKSTEDSSPLSLGGQSAGPNPLAHGIAGGSLLDLAEYLQSKKNK